MIFSFSIALLSILKLLLWKFTLKIKKQEPDNYFITRLLELR